MLLSAFPGAAGGWLTEDSQQKKGAGPSEAHSHRHRPPRPSRYIRYPEAAVLIGAW